MFEQSAWLLVYSGGGADSDRVLYIGDAHENQARRGPLAHGVESQTDKTRIGGKNSIFSMFVRIIIYIVITSHLN